jgi:predicted Fe-Mo cluster-binding NifX family protein
MKIAISATGPTLNDTVDPRFGRCAYFLIVKPENLTFEAVENTSVALSGGAGIQAAQMLAEKGVQTILTGNCGPNAHKTLAAAGVEIVTGCEGTIRDVVKQYTAGTLAPAEGPNVAGHFGTGAGGQQAFTGRGGGRGMGRGGGRGMGMGGGRRLSGRYAGAPAAAPSGSSPTPGDNLKALKQHAAGLERQLQQLRRQIQDMEQPGKKTSKKDQP